MKRIALVVGAMWLCGLAAAAESQQVASVSPDAARPLALPPLAPLAAPEKQPQTAGAVGAVTVTVRKRSVVPGDQALLGDVSTLTGGDDQTRRQLASIDLGAAPPVGRNRRLDAAAIEEALENAGLSKQVAGVSVPPNCTIERKAQTVASGQMEKAVTEAILGSLSADPKDAVIRSWNLPPEIRVPAGSLKLDVDLQRLPREVGTRSFDIAARVDGRIVQRVRGSVLVDVMVDVVRAKTPLERGDVVRQEQIETCRQPLTSLAAKALRNPEAAIGRLCVRSVREGEVLSSDALRVPALIKVNETVLMNLVAPGMRMQTKGVSRGQGGMGDIVKVLNPSSGREVMARVVGPQKVEVVF